MLITDIEQQKKNKDRYSVFVDDEFVFGLLMEDILFFKLKIGEEISEERFNYIKDIVLYVKAQDAALKYLSYKMRSEKEMEKKLFEYEYSEEIVEKVIAFLKKYNYVDDLEYCRAYIRQNTKSNPKGSFAIRSKLKELGVKDKVIAEAITAEDVDEAQCAERLLYKKIGDTKTVSFKEKKKLQDFLLRKGYSYDIIKEVFSNMEIKVDNTADWE